MQFKVGNTVWRGHRDWVNLFDFTGGVAGWNTTFIPYRIIGVTAQQIKVQVLPDSIRGIPADKRPLFLKRSILTTRGKQYHARFHENKQYKQLARQLHPDAGGTNAKFIELQKARDEALRIAMPNLT